MNTVTKNFNKLLFLSYLGLSSTCGLYAEAPLKHKSMEFFSSVLATMPIVTIRLKSTELAIRKTMKDIKDFTTVRSPKANAAEEKEFVDIQRNLILQPVREFFDHVVEHSSMIKPILEESNNLHPKLERPLLLTKFFSPDKPEKPDKADNKPSIEAFCKKEVNNLHNLKKLCAELIYFINDIYKSLSPQAQAAYHAKLAEMKEAKAQPSNA